MEYCSSLSSVDYISKLSTSPQQLCDVGDTSRQSWQSKMGLQHTPVHHDHEEDKRGAVRPEKAGFYPKGGKNLGDPWTKKSKNA